MEINRVNTPKTVGTELKKQSQKVKETGLKQDKFEKSLTPDIVMENLANIKEPNGKRNKFTYPSVLEGIKKSITEDPRKCVFAQKLAPQENISQLGLRNILALPYDTVKDITDIATKKNKNDELKILTSSELADVYHMSPEDVKRVKQLIDTPLSGENVIKAVQEPTKLDTKKLVKKVDDMVKTVGEDNLKEITFARDAYSKGDYTLVAVKNEPDADVDFSKSKIKGAETTLKEVMDSKLKSYAVEELTSYKLPQGKSYKIQKVNDFRNNTTAKTRYEFNEKNIPIVTHEIRLIKDKKGKLQRTEYTGWWYSCIPVEFIKEKKYPLPFFIHRDDIEYGLRANGQFIFMNGISIWHEAFENKLPGFLEYYDIRNLAITNAIHNPEYTAKEFKKMLFIQVSSNIGKYRYKYVDLNLKGAVDFLRGFKWFYHVDTLKLHGELAKYNYQARPVEEFIGYHGIEAEDLNPCGRPEAEPPGKARKLWGMLSMNGHFFPAYKSETTKVARPNPNIYDLYRCKEVVYADAAGKAICVQRSRGELIKAYIKMLKVFRLIDKHYDRVCDEYRRNYSKLESREFWQNYLQLK